ncbi:ATP-dependent Clp protease adapter ClpS [Cryobacterium tepidiphilum]|uniref:ATP-dependent Clp protease adapter protein ClpS n=1 Tax=Cryobacterium tepidiphilum TaxID=2486026 RepID=A0A3M8LDU6_9MICO|nr:ATP-dependent Clp protease adapter ClpS [Cryobacterium tepidiphilum]
MVQTLEDTQTWTESQVTTPWVAIVWNDPVNLMSYVAYVFRSYFRYPPEQAEQLMLEVHNAGKAVVATGNREAMERHVEAMHEYGLWATVSRAGA